MHEAMRLDALFFLLKAIVFLAFRKKLRLYFITVHSGSLFCVATLLSAFGRSPKQCHTVALSRSISLCIYFINTSTFGSCGTWLLCAREYLKERTGAFPSLPPRTVISPSASLDVGQHHNCTTNCRDLFLSLAFVPSSPGQANELRSPCQGPFIFQST